MDRQLSIESSSANHGTNDDISLVSGTYAFRRCRSAAATMLLALAASLLVCSQYSYLPVKGDIPCLHTVMMYSYYASQLVGTITVMIPVVQRLLNLPVLFALALLRLPVVYMIFCGPLSGVVRRCAHDSNMFSSDLQVVCFYSFYMWLGGGIFSRCFSIATSLFVSPADRAMAAKVMNVAYFAGLIVVSVALLVTAA